MTYGARSLGGRGYGDTTTSNLAGITVLYPGVRQNGIGSPGYGLQGFGGSYMVRTPIAVDSRVAYRESDVNVGAALTEARVGYRESDVDVLTLTLLWGQLVMT